jgi:hypothetical protein
MSDLKSPLFGEKKQLKNISFPHFNSPEKSKRSIPLLTLFSFLLLVIISLLGVKIYSMEKKDKKTRKHMRHLSHEMVGIGSSKTFGNTRAPLRLAEVPFAEELQVVKSVKQVQIRNMIAPLNPTLLRSPNGGYDLFFRYDVPSAKAINGPFFCRIGAVHLDEHFEQGEKEFQRLNLGSEYAEDPRAFFFQGKPYLFFNQLDLNQPRCRTMSLACLDPETLTVRYKTDLDLNLQWIEKNWPPFEVTDEEGKSSLYFEYQITPRKLYAIEDPNTSHFQDIRLPKDIAYTHLPWVGKWGTIRGGTPPLKIGDEYLSFFHSSFKELNGMYWYVMGAYTFNAKYPFKITRMSAAPILYRGIYETPIIHTADPSKRVCFPSGFVIEKREDGDLIYLACGDNDCAINIVTIDKEKLLKSMVPFESIEQ